MLPQSLFNFCNYLEMAVGKGHKSVAESPIANQKVSQSHIPVLVGLSLLSQETQWTEKHSYHQQIGHSLILYDSELWCYFIRGGIFYL